MEKELEECGWEAGEEVCPECQNSETEMAQHWGLCHGGVDRAIKKYQGSLGTPPPPIKDPFRW